MAQSNQELRGFNALDTALAKAETLEDFTDVARMAKVAEELARQGNLGVTAQNDAVEYRVRAYSGAADLIDKMPSHTGGRGKTHSRSATGLPPTYTVQKWRDARTAYRRGWRETLDPDTETSFAMYVAEGARIRSGIDPDHGDDWYTPRWLFEQLDLTFDLDVCAPANPDMRTVPARRCYTTEDDGLTQTWDGLVWCNPPYSTPGEWATRWVEHGNGLLLTHIPANAAWAVHVWRHANAAIWLQAMHFERPNGQTYRPGYALQLAALGDQAEDALARVDAPKSGAIWRRDQ